jgi:Kinesin motor domain
LVAYEVYVSMTEIYNEKV